MDLLQLYNNLSLLMVAASLLAILGLRISTGSTSQQIALIREYRASLEETSRNCMRARSAALAREFEAHDNGAFGSGANVVPLSSKRLVGRYYVEESERLIRTLASLARDEGDTRVSQMRRRLKELKLVQLESVRLLTALETGQH
ncbi:MAG: hypothetical protein JNK19_08550 [Tabrizicola sp.]|nr:hypothetical protein [Tabrizicola sp.]